MFLHRSIIRSKRNKLKQFCHSRFDFWWSLNIFLLHSIFCSYDCHFNWTCSLQMNNYTKINFIFAIKVIYYILKHWYILDFISNGAKLGNTKFSFVEFVLWCKKKKNQIWNRNAFFLLFHLKIYIFSILYHVSDSFIHIRIAFHYYSFQKNKFLKISFSFCMITLTRIDQTYLTQRNRTY